MSCDYLRCNRTIEVPWNNVLLTISPDTFLDPKLAFMQPPNEFDHPIRYMCVREKRKIYVPSEKAYGKEGKGEIPANSNLMFTCECVNVSEN